MTNGSGKTKPWAVLAYTIADDKGGGGALDAAAKDELKALCDAADFGRVSIAAQVDFKRTRGVYRGSITAPPPKSRDFEPVRAENHPLWKKILSGVRTSTLKVEREVEDLNAARANVLQTFLHFGRTECDAERYVVFFYGHAYGPMGLFYDAAAGQRDPNTLRLNDLADALHQPGGRASVIVFRDCFMNTLETACQLRHAAEFIVASQAEAPIAGVWPWLNFMAALMPGAASADVARAIAMQLGRFLDDPAHRGPFADVPYSLIDVSAVDEIIEPLKSLTAALESARGNDARVKACATALDRARIGYPDDMSQPGDPALVDVPTMCDSLRALEGDPVAGPAAALGDIVRSRLVGWHHSQKGRFQGISLYCKPVRPRDLERSYIESGNAEDAARDAAYYEQLALSRATGWHRIALHPLGT